MLTPFSRRLYSWVKHGLISEAQGQAILDFEGRAAGRSWVAFGVVGIGVTAIATGVISLIAANWESIPPAIKLLGYFVIQAAAGIHFLRQEKQSSVWREGFLALFLLLFWAGIGLFAQVYNLEGEGWQSCALWLTLSLPGVAIARQPLFAHVWTVLLQVTVAWWLTSGWHQHNETLRAALIATVPLILTALSFWSQAATRLSPQFKAAFTFWGIGTYAVAGTILGNLIWEVARKAVPTSDLPYLLIPWVALAVAITGSLARRQASWDLRRITAVFLLLIGVFITLPLFFDFDSGSHLARQIIGAGGFIIIAGVGAYLAARDHQKRLYEIATQLIALRFIFIYFQVFGDLSYTGFGLIFSGAVILGFAYFWNRVKKVLLSRIQKKGGES